MWYAPFSPVPGGIPAVCPHCWELNLPACLLCGRCGADMRTLLQETGGLRLTAPVQSPVPVRVGHRLSVTQRIALLGFLAVLLLGQFFGALLSVRPFPEDLPDVPAAPSNEVGLD